MSTESINRKPGGSPKSEGGRFAPGARTESDIQLEPAPAAVDEKVMDRIALMLGTAPDWDGAADYLEDIADLVGATEREHPGDADPEEYLAALAAVQAARAGAPSATTTQLDELAMLLGASPQWQGADYLGYIADIVGQSGRPHPGDADPVEYVAQIAELTANRAHPAPCSSRRRVDLTADNTPLQPNAPAQLWRTTAGLSPETAALMQVRPDDWEPFGNALDRLVDSVHQGQLSRGVVNGERYSNLRSWQHWAETRAKQEGLDDPAAAAKYDDFAKGLEHAVIALMSDKAEVAPNYVISRIIWPLGAHVRPGDAWRARSLLTNKRTSKASRAEWAYQATQAPSAAARRGFLTAAVVLSGTDDWWGLRDDPDAVVLTDDIAPEQ